MSKLKLIQNPTLADYQKYVRDMAAERGFDKDSIPKEFMMLVEEVGELAKSARKFSGMKLADNALKQETKDEFADVFIILLGLCNMLDVDLEQAFRDKEEKNKKRKWE